MNGEPVPNPSPAASAFLNDATATVFVVGHMSYDDFAGRHYQRFCNPVSVMKGGTSRGPTTTNEYICAKYDKQKDEYSLKPQVPKLGTAPALPAIACKIPDM
jgi:hypothetical protein